MIANVSQGSSPLLSCSNYHPGQPEILIETHQSKEGGGERAVTAAAAWFGLLWCTLHSPCDVKAEKVYAYQFLLNWIKRVRPSILVISTSIAHVKYSAVAVHLIRWWATEKSTAYSMPSSRRVSSWRTAVQTCQAWSLDSCRNVRHALSQLRSSERFSKLASWLNLLWFRASISIWALHFC